MTKLINNANRVIVVGEIMLVPGKSQSVEDVKKLTAKYPRLAELLKTGDITEDESKVSDTEDKADRTINRRNRG